MLQRTSESDDLMLPAAGEPTAVGIVMCRAVADQNQLHPPSAMRGRRVTTWG